MLINWPLIITLFCLSIPGVCIAIKRIMYFLLSNNTDELKKRMSRFAILQTLVMVLLMSFAGTVLSSRTGLHAFLWEGGNTVFSVFQSIILPVFIYSFLGLVVFCILYYGLVASVLDEHNFAVMKKIRHVLGVDACVLYGGIVEEVIARWGLMNLLVFFSILFANQINNVVMWSAIVLSGILFGIGQVPVYLAAGCLSSRRLIYSILVLYLWQALLFGFIFWCYGLVASILAHILFQLGWAIYDKKEK